MAKTILDKGKLVRVDDKHQVDYTIPTGSDFLSSASNLIPGIGGVSGGRVLLGDKASVQAISLINREAPLVQAIAAKGAKSFEKHFGEQFAAIHSPVHGTVAHVDEHKMVVKDEAGKEHELEIYHNFNSGKKSFLHHTPVVKVGDTVKKDDLLATSNFSDKDGNLALGVNLKTAIMPYRSNNFEDAFVVTESGAKKMTAEQMFTSRLEKRLGVNTGKDTYISLFPNKFYNQQLGKLDSDGVVIKGTVLKYGDPVILAYSPKALKTTDIHLGKLSKALGNAYKDLTETWDYETDGIVTDVAKSGNMIAVNIKTQRGLNVGDKISIGYGNKGVTGCYPSPCQVLTSDGWANWSEVNKETNFACIVDGKGTFQKPIRLFEYDYNDDLIGFKNGMFNYAVTPNHRMYVGNYAKVFSFKEAKDTYGKGVVHKASIEFESNSTQTEIDIKDYLAVRNSPTHESRSITKFNLNDFAYFLGLYLSEGSLSYYESKGVGKTKTQVRSYKIQISQVKEWNLKSIGDCLTRLGVKWWYLKASKQFTFSSFYLYHFLKQFGLCYEKFIPKMAFTWPQEARKQLLDGLILGDGYIKELASNRLENAHEYAFQYTSTSWQLTQDVEFLSTLLCWNVRIDEKTDQRKRRCWDVKSMANNEISQVSGTHFKELYEGKVYCAEVPGNLLYVRYPDGRPFWCGNSILPDTLSPTTKDGKPVDILLNSMSITSRVSPALVSTLGLGKVAEKLGKPIKITPFVEGSAVKKTEELMAKHGVEDVEELYDPVSGTTIKALVGPLFFNRLVHIAEDKLSNRSQGVGYDWNCVKIDDEILTRRGWVKGSDITVADEFFTVDKDNKIQYQTPSHLIRKDYEGDMYGFRSKYIDYLVTPDHRMYISSSPKHTFKFKDAKDCFNKSFSVLQFGFTYDGTIGDTVKIGNSEFNSKLFASLCGWFVSEGSVVENDDFHIYQSSTANPEKHAEIETLFKALGISYTYYNRDGVGQGFRSNNKDIIAFLFKESGNSCYTKRIPRLIFELPIEARKEFILSAIKGDGSEYIHASNSAIRVKPNIITQYFTCNKKLADDMQELCVSVGWGAFIGVKKAKLNKLGDHIINSGVSYSVGITKTRTRSTVANHKDTSKHYTEQYKGEVFCVTLSETGLIYIRRNNKPILIGNCQPAKSPDESSKRLGNLSTTSLLSHGATAFLRDVATVRATKNDEFWRKLKLGLPAPEPKVPFIFDKFIASLQGAGIKVTRTDDQFGFLPQTDKDILALSQGAIGNAKTFRVKGDNLIPEKGGLFDPTNTGIFGENFNHIDLNFKVPNPISEDPLRRMLKMTKDQFEKAVVSGELEKKLETLDIDKKIEDCKQYIKSGRVSDRSNAVKVLAFLNTLKTNNMHPKDLMLSKVPVIPSQYRPVQVTEGLTLSANVNHLYKDLLLNNEKVGDLTHVPQEIADKAKLEQYQAVKAIYGLSEPISIKHKEKNVKGILAEILGTHGGSAKGSEFQAKVVNKPMDLIGRGVATGDVKLDLDEISIPQDIAWKIYSPFLIRRLVRKGVPATLAHDYVKQRNPAAIQVLHEEMTDRPVVMSRDPALHKFNLMGFKPKINPDPKNKTVSVNPLVFKGFNLDLDGDQVSVSTPAGDDAKEEVKEKMLPSRNLLSIRSFSPLYVPSNEAALGIYQMSSEKENNKPVEFDSEEEAIKAYHNGKVNVGTQVVIKGK